MSTWIKLTIDPSDESWLSGWNTECRLLYYKHSDTCQISSICQGLFFIDEISDDSPLLLTNVSFSRHEIESFLYNYRTQDVEAAASLYRNDDDRGLLYFRRGADFVFCAKNALRNYNHHLGLPLSLLDCLHEAILIGLTCKLIRLPNE